MSLLAVRALHRLRCSGEQGLLIVHFQPATTRALWHPDLPQKTAALTRYCFGIRLALGRPGFLNTIHQYKL